MFRLAVVWLACFAAGFSTAEVVAGGQAGFHDHSTGRRRLMQTLAMPQMSAMPFNLRASDSGSVQLTSLKFPFVTSEQANGNTGSGGHHRSEDEIENWIPAVDLHLDEPVGDDAIPNMFHFLFGLGGKKEKDLVTFQFFHYLAIKSAIVTNPGSRAYVYYATKPSGKWWDAALKLPSVHGVLVHPKNTIFGVQMKRYAHVADRMRLELLFLNGGIYVDMDTLILRDMTPLRHQVVEEGRDAFILSECKLRGHTEASMSNALIGARPNSTFLRLWWNTYHTFSTGEWAEHSVIGVGRIIADHPELVLVAAKEPYYPGSKGFEMRQDEPLLFNASWYSKFETMTAFQSAYSVHLFEHYNKKALNALTPETICSSVTTGYSSMAKRFVDC